MPKKLSMHIKVNLDKALAKVGDMALKHRAKRIILGLNLQDGDEILEIGCGNGYYLSLLNRLGTHFKLTGLDNDKHSLADAVRFVGNKKVKLIYGFAEKLPFINKSFDKIVMSEVIEHVRDEKLALKEAFRVLRNGGILTLTTCNIDYPFLWDPINWILQHIFGTHIKSGFWAGIWNQHERLYKKNRIEKLIEEAGFKIDSSEALTGWCLPFNHYIVNFVARLIYSRKLPEYFSSSLNKFRNDKQIAPLKIIFGLVNFYDKLNDLMPRKIGVSIFVKVKKE